jgi:hypothetical protein
MDICNFADNIVLELALPNSRRRIKVITTGNPDEFKCERGVAGISVYEEKELLTLRAVKQLLVDSVVNGFVLETNKLFQKGFYGVCQELASEHRAKPEETGASAADAL